MYANVTLTVKQSKLAGQKYTLNENGICLIGRSRECDVQVPSDLEFLDVSRRHCLIAVYGHEVRIRDMHSRNGTFVNGRRLNRLLGGNTAPEDSALTAELKDGDELALGAHGGLVFKVHVESIEPELAAEEPAVVRLRPQKKTDNIGIGLGTSPCRRSGKAMSILTSQPSDCCSTPADALRTSCVCAAIRILVRGQVQGVGFRPFIFRFLTVPTRRPGSQCSRRGRCRIGRHTGGPQPVSGVAHLEGSFRGGDQRDRDRGYGAVRACFVYHRAQRPICAAPGSGAS